MLRDDSSSDFVPVLMYHDIAEAPFCSTSGRWVVPPALFAEHLSALIEAGYQTRRITHLSDARADQAVAFITFDDGYASVVEHALPALTKQGMTATLFLTSAFVGSRASLPAARDEEHRRYLAWSDVRDAVAAGFEIGSHSHRHLELDLLNEQQLEQDLAVSKTILEDETSSVVQSLAYPFGYHTAKVRSAASKAGYRVGCEVGYGLYNRRSGNPFCVRRLLVPPDMSGECLLRLVAEGRPTAGQLARRHTRPVWRAVRQTRATVQGLAGCGRSRP